MSELGFEGLAGGVGLSGFCVGQKRKCRCGGSESDSLSECWLISGKVCHDLKMCPFVEEVLFFVCISKIEEYRFIAYFEG